MTNDRVKRVGSSTSRIGFGRALSILTFLPIASRVPMYTRLIASLMIDERIPANRKALLTNKKLSEHGIDNRSRARKTMAGTRGHGA